MAEAVRCTLEELPGLIARDLERLERRVQLELAGAAIDGAHAIEPHIPVAFAELRGSLHVDASRAVEGEIRIVLDAPHAEAVERGARPHTPPLEPLVRWVKLRGMQGLTKTGRVRRDGKILGVGGTNARAWGPTSAAQAARVATSIRAFRATGELATDINAPVKIARAIQMAIRKNGTKPHWMVRRTLPEIEVILGRHMKRAVRE
jgi:hypothetical protein